MAGQPIPDEVRRFLLAKPIGVPHVEAILMMRREPEHGWKAAELASRLYVASPVAASVLAALADLALVVESDGAFRYAPPDAASRALITRLDEAYAKNLVGVTRLIHSTRDRTAEEFAAAFRFRRE